MNQKKLAKTLRIIARANARYERRRIAADTHNVGCCKKECRDQHYGVGYSHQSKILAFRCSEANDLLDSLARYLHSEATDRQLDAIHDLTRKSQLSTVINTYWY